MHINDRRKYLFPHGTRLKLYKKHCLSLRKIDFSAKKHMVALRIFIMVFCTWSPRLALNFAKSWSISLKRRDEENCRHCLPENRANVVRIQKITQSTRFCHQIPHPDYEAVTFQVNPTVSVEAVCDLRAAVDWDRLEEDYPAAFDGYWGTVGAFDGAHNLIGWCAILSDGVRHAVLLDVIVHPTWQRQSIGPPNCKAGHSPHSRSRHFHHPC